MVIDDVNIALPEIKVNVDPYHKGDDVLALVDTWLETVILNVGMRNAGHIG